MIRRLGCMLVLALSAISYGGTAQAGPCAGPAASWTGTLLTQITPVTLRILQARLIPVPATDGFIHLAYAAQVTNMARDEARLREIVPVDPLQGLDATGVNSVVDMDGKPITGSVRPFRPGTVDGVETRSPDVDRLQGGASGIMFFDVRYRTSEDVPRLLSHRLEVTLGSTGQPLSERTDPIDVSCEAPVVISPPLTGSDWWNANGCCGTISPHRGATLPVNGDLKVPEQFAID